MPKDSRDQGSVPRPEVKEGDRLTIHQWRLAGDVTFDVTTTSEPVWDDDYRTWVIGYHEDEPGMSPEYALWDQDKGHWEDGEF